MMAAAAVGLAAHAGHLEGLVSFALKFLRRTSAKILENHCAKGPHDHASRSTVLETFGQNFSCNKSGPSRKYLYGLLHTRLWLVVERGLDGVRALPARQK